MTIHKSTLSLCCALCLFIMSTFAWSTPKPESVYPGDNAKTHANLVAVDWKYFDVTKSAGPSAWQNADAIHVKPASLSFSKYWLRQHRGEMTQRDKTRLTERYAESLHEQLVKAFEKNGWKTTETPGANTIIVTPKLTDFKLMAPDLGLGPMKTDLVHYVGSSRLSLTFALGNEQNVIGFLEDYDETSRTGGMGMLKPTDRATNYRDFKLLFKKWSKRAARFASSVSQANEVSLK